MTLVASILPLALLGALLGLDVVSFPQAMISRPLVAATLAGALVGDPGRGLLVGVVLELFALEMLPFGASRYPEWGSASVVGGALYSTQPAASGGALAVSVFAALVTAAAGGWSMVQHRRLIARRATANRGEVTADSITALQLWGLTSDFVRGAILTGLVLLLFLPLAHELLAGWKADAALSRAVVVALAGAVGGAAVWNVTHTFKSAPWLFLGGLALGTCLLVAA
ncbi:MAG TPA: PTS sugar transporter subunit IIC [Gemmatimonadaceae bacterium]|nr:PTS sugar transporter subunit IIC [Gemmatimonadaceae bacterium]